LTKRVDHTFIHTLIQQQIQELTDDDGDGWTDRERTKKLDILPPIWKAKAEDKCKMKHLYWRVKWHCWMMITAFGREKDLRKRKKKMKKHGIYLYRPVCKRGPRKSLSSCFTFQCGGSKMMMMKLTHKNSACVVSVLRFVLWPERRLKHAHGNHNGHRDFHTHVTFNALSLFWNAS